MPIETLDLGRRAAAPAGLPEKQGKGAWCATLSALLADDPAACAVRTLFQPILDLRQGIVYGYEALTRGPEGSPLESPVALFRAAWEQGCGAELELHAVRCAVQRFAALGAPGRLFVNFSPAVLAQGEEDPETLLALMRRCGMAPGQLVIELTENGALLDSSRAWNELLRCRAMGFGIAIDDLGEGFASLRLWSELRPEYVKVDKHFVHDIHSDPIKLQIGKAIQQIAQVSGTSVIAEGLEREADFQAVRDLGMRLGQGYLIGRPGSCTGDSDARKIWTDLSSGPLAAFPVPGRSVNRVTARRLLRQVAPVSPGQDNESVCARFEGDPDLQFVAVVEDGAPRGIIGRSALVDRFARPYRRELFGRRPCAMFMDPDPVVVEANASIQEISLRVAGTEQRAMPEGFVITEQGRYAGIGTAQDLMRAMTELQIEAARYANPLTLLPGNVPIAEHVDRLIARGCRFAACYCDLDHFKPFNDVFGYQRGDEAIQLAARVLAQACDPRIDFLGHVGGDDFVLVLQSEDWQQRCAALLARFEETSRSLFDADHLREGGFAAPDRRGRQRRYPLLSISVGVVPVEPGTFQSHAEVASAAAEAKRMAKRTAGNSLFVERRRHASASARSGTGIE